MNSKVVVYAVLAVALGYFLISTAPAIMTPPEREPTFAGDEGKPLLGAPEESDIRGPEDQPSKKNQIWNEAFQFSVWIINLFIALGVYMVAKRRFP